MILTMTDNPWQTAQEAFNKYARIDPAQGQRLAHLSKQLVRNDKLAWAIESGRVYGLRQQKYDMALRRQLNADWRRAPVEQHW